jgi:hypothetical protein
MTTSRPSGMRTSASATLCSVTPFKRRHGVRAVTARCGSSECCSGLRRYCPVIERGLRIRSCTVPAPTTSPPFTPAAGPEIHDVIRATDRILVVFHDDQRIFVQSQLRERIEQHGIVAWMQSNRGLIEHIAHAAQV